MEVCVEQVEEVAIVYARGAAVLCADRPMAMLLEITAEEILAVAGGEGTIVTVYYMDIGRARVLIDGVMGKGEEVCLIRGRGKVCVRMVDPFLYVRSEKGVETLLLEEKLMPDSDMVESGDIKENGCQTEEGRDEEPTEEIVSEDMGDVERESESERESRTETCFDGEHGTWVTENSGSVGYIGCRETRPEAGVYAVQFLFEDRGAPVICVEGGGLMGVTCESGVWTTCTFRGLQADKSYRFWVYDDDWIIEVIYQDGRFCRQGVIKE